ncbi:MAG: phytanoyl-CoA dioxygenase family protein [Planctomycetota bacterium]
MKLSKNTDLSQPQSDPANHYPTPIEQQAYSTQSTKGAPPADTPEREALLKGKGYFVVRGVLDEDDRRAIKDRLRRICEHIDHYRKYIELIKDVPDPALAQHPDALLRHTWVNEIGFRDEVLWERCAAHPRLLDVAQKVLGSTVYPLNGGGFFLKPPRSQSTVPWHQDASPFRVPPEAGESRNPLLFDYWLGVDEATIENGCLQLIPNSQKLGRLEHHDKGGVFPELHDPSEYGFKPDDIVSIPMEAGDMLVWHQDMFHYSDPNRSEGQRIGKASVYMAGQQEAELRNLIAQKMTGLGCNNQRPALCIDGEIQTLRPDAIIPLPKGF